MSSITSGLNESATVKFDGKVTWDMFEDGGYVVEVVELAYHWNADCFIAKIVNPEPWMPPFSSVLINCCGDWIGFAGDSWL